MGKVADQSILIRVKLLWIDDRNRRYQKRLVCWAIHNHMQSLLARIESGVWIVKREELCRSRRIDFRSECR